MSLLAIITLSRFGMYASLQGRLSSYANPEAVAVSISGSQNLLLLLGLKAKEVIDARCTMPEIRYSEFEYSFK
jgi:hypothetical protein